MVGFADKLTGGDAAGERRAAADQQDRCGRSRDWVAKSSATLVETDANCSASSTIKCGTCRRAKARPRVGSSVAKIRTPRGPAQCAILREFLPADLQ